jgi:hypothetical protein
MGNIFASICRRLCHVARYCVPSASPTYSSMGPTNRQIVMERLCQPIGKLNEKHRNSDITLLLAISYVFFIICSIRSSSDNWNQSVMHIWQFIYPSVYPSRARRDSTACHLIIADIITSVLPGTPAEQSAGPVDLVPHARISLKQVRNAPSHNYAAAPLLTSAMIRLYHALIALLPSSVYKYISSFAEGGKVHIRTIYEFPPLMNTRCETRYLKREI